MTARSEPPIVYFLRMFRRYWTVLPVLALLGVLGALFEAAGISLIAVLMQALLAGPGAPLALAGWLTPLIDRLGAIAGSVVAALAGLVALFVGAKLAIDTSYGLLSSWFRNTLTEDVRNRVHAQYLDLSYEWLRRRDPGRLHSILSSESWALADSLYVVARLGTNVCAVLVFGGFIVALSPRVAAVVAGGSFLIFLLVGRFAKRMRRLGEQVAATNIALTDRMLADLQGMRTIRAFAREDSEKRSFRVLSAEAKSRFLEIGRLQAIIHPISEATSLMLIGAVVLLASVWSIPGAATLTIIFLLYRLQPQLRELDSNRMALLGHSASLALVREVLDPADGSYPPQGHLPFEHLKRDIAFQKVSFGFDASAAPVLDAISFAIPARGVTVIGGTSGAGKTTIVNLLLRLYQPRSGVILVDGKPLADLRRTDWLARVALAGQDADLITGTLRENIAMARPGASASAVHEAAAIAGIADFIDELPDGFETAVGDRGLNLSGGQRQRVGIARAVLRDPDLLILDEALSGVEATLEQAIYDRLRARFSDRAIILITHRGGAFGRPDHYIQLGSAVASAPSTVKAHSQ